MIGFFVQGRARIMIRTTKFHIGLELGLGLRLCLPIAIVAEANVIHFQVIAIEMKCAKMLVHRDDTGTIPNFLNFTVAALTY